MMKAVKEWVANNRGPSGQGVCLQYNLHGYNLKRTRFDPPVAPCPGCNLAHIRVPEEKVKDGSKGRTWRREATQEEAGAK